MNVSTNANVKKYNCNTCNRNTQPLQSTELLEVESGRWTTTEITDSTCHGGEWIACSGPTPVPISQDLFLQAGLYR